MVIPYEVIIMSLILFSNIWRYQAYSGITSFVAPLTPVVSVTISAIQDSSNIQALKLNLTLIWMWRNHAVMIYCQLKFYVF